MFLENSCTINNTQVILLNIAHTVQTGHQGDLRKKGQAKSNPLSYMVNVSQNPK